jgi:hypothetical protein
MNETHIESFIYIYGDCVRFIGFNIFFQNPIRRRLHKI